MLLAHKLKHRCSSRNNRQCLLLLDQKLIELSKVDDAPIAFVDDKNFSGATIINGRYSEDNGLLKAQVTFVSNNAVSKQVTVEAVNAELLAEAILKELDY